jgi:hypothetical protein
LIGGSKDVCNNAAGAVEKLPGLLLRQEFVLSHKNVFQGTDGDSALADLRNALLKRLRKVFA